MTSDDFKLIRDLEEVERFVADLVSSPAPFFLGRVGGSDFEAVAYSKHRLSWVTRIPEVLLGRLLNLQNRIPFLRFTIKSHMRNVSKLNGYFDRSASSKRFQSYLRTMDVAYKSADALLYATKNTITAVEDPGSRFLFNPYLRELRAGKELMSFEFVESLHPLLRSMERWPEGLRILVVSPFSQSVEHQAKRFSEIHLPVFCLPEFRFSTLQSPITYSDPARPKSFPSQAKSNWWGDELELLRQQVADAKFDLALLSCGSYGMPLGQFIRELGKKAIYLGGGLNMLFNIYGERYSHPGYESLLNLNMRIDPMEQQMVETMTIGREWENEALLAYFKKPDLES